MIELAAAERLGSALAWSATQKQLLAGLPVGAPDGREPAAVVLDRIWTHHLERRQRMGVRLHELVLALNHAGIVPMLLKGVRSLWLGEPEWRDMRDIDLLVPAKQAKAAEAIARAAGYHYSDDGLGVQPWGHHHADNLYRDDLPGWLELHHRAGMLRSEILMPTRELVEAARPMPRDGATALVLPPVHDVLYGLIHHYAGHRETRDGGVELKGLFEFAMGVQALTATERAELSARAAWDSRLLGVLDVWIAAAADRYGLVPEPPLALVPDAVARWARLRQNVKRPRKSDALREELALALAPARLRRMPQGDRWMARAGMRARLAGWLALNWGNRFY